MPDFGLATRMRLEATSCVTGAKSLIRVERQAVVERGRDRRAVGVLQDGVAVGRRFRDRVGGERAAGAGAVLDDHRLAELVGELAAEQPRQHVDRAAGRERHDQPDRAVGIVLGVGGRR